MALKNVIKKEIEIEAEHLAHRLLWLGAETLDGQRDEGAAAPFPAMASLLFVYLALEAFLNDLGTRIRPEIWRDERKFFGRKWRGTLGKLNYLAGELGLELPTDRRPYQSIKELDHRRNRLVHPRTSRFSRKVMTSDPANYFERNPLVTDLDDREFFARAREDVSQICNGLLARAPSFVKDALGEDAFYGSIDRQTTWLPAEPRAPGDQSPPN